MASPIQSLASLRLELPPSCIEFCPAYPAYFCVGTYNLEKDEARASGDTSRPQSRNGSIAVYKVEGFKVHLVGTIPQPSAILDLHFQQSAGRQDVFAVASSTATLSIFRLTPHREHEGGLVELVSVVRIDGIDESVLFLSCSWHPTIRDLLAVTTSNGTVHMISLDDELKPKSLSTSSILTHDLEAWTVVFSPDVRTGDNGESIVTVYSGGDDSTLRYTSCALIQDQALEEQEFPQLPFAACKLAGHEAGVTAILPTSMCTSDGSRIVVTGSYDDNIRVFSIADPVDTFGMRRTTSLAKLNLGGGVWRLKLISQHSDPDGEDGHWELRVLASCMHAGARILKISGSISGLCAIVVMASFEEHKSMNYGSDTHPVHPDVCISTSFYDTLLCLWTAKSE